VSTELSIRSFSYPKDLQAITTLWQNSGPGIGLGRSDSEDELVKKLKRDPELFLVAEQNGRLVGAVLGGFDGRRGLVYHLAVDASRQKMGIGTALMDELERRLHNLGCIRGYLLVKYGNEDANRFYQQRGWTVMPLHVYGKDL